MRSLFWSHDFNPIHIFPMKYIGLKCHWPREGTVWGFQCLGTIAFTWLLNGGAHHCRTLCLGPCAPGTWLPSSHPLSPLCWSPICPSSRRLVCGSSCFVSLSSSPPQWILNFNKTCSRKLDKFPVTPFLAQPAVSLSILQLFIEHQIQARSSRHWWKSCEWIRKKRCLVCMELTS